MREDQDANTDQTANQSNKGDGVSVWVMALFSIGIFLIYLPWIVDLRSDLRNGMSGHSVTYTNQDYMDAFGLDIGKHERLKPVANSIMSDGLISNSEWRYLKKEWDALEQNNETDQ